MTNGEVNLGPLRFKLDRWTVSVFCLLAVMAGTAYVWNEFLEKAIQPGTVDVPYAQLAQFAETQEHFGKETLAAERFGPPEDPSAVSVALYKHGESFCVAVTRDYGAGSVTDFILDPRRIFEEDVIAAGWFKEKPEKCKGKCLKKHPGAPLKTETPDERDECVIWIWWEWPDGCLLYQRWDHCEREWVDEEPIPECCVH
jgi:hypothetical protein